MSKLASFKRKIKTSPFSCQHPKCTTTLHLTVDHIIPRVLLKTLGMESLAESDEDNFQILCKKHNGEKGNELDYTNPRTLSLLKKYINIWIEKHADYFIPPEKRVYKIGVKCCCVPIEEKPAVPQHLDTAKWKNPPKFAQKSEEVDEDDW